MAYTKDGFHKSLNNSTGSNSYVLLANGGTKSLTDFKADWNQTTTTAIDYIKNKPDIDAIINSIDNKQDKLISGTNIKTINSYSILGSGNFVLEQAPEIQIGGTIPTDENIKLFVDTNEDDTVEIYTKQQADGRFMVVVTSSNIPTENTITYTKDSETKNFNIGDEIRVPDQDADTGYTFYKLYNLVTDGGMTSATWDKVGGGGEYESLPAVENGTDLSLVTTGEKFYWNSKISNISPSEYTLEQSSDPAFDVSNKAAVENYVANMGGYMFYTTNGTTYAAKLNRTSWDSFADGTAIDSTIEAACDTMVHVPDCYFTASDKTMKLYGLNPLGQHKFESPHWVGAYKMDAAGYSRPNVVLETNKKVSDLWNLAQLKGSDFGLANYQFHCLINAVYQAYYGNLNSQATVGSGFQNSSYVPARDIIMGLTKSLGDGSGTVLYTGLGNNQYPVKLFGFEDLWSKLWEFRPGIRFYMDGDVRNAIVYNGNRVSNTITEGRIINGVLSCGVTTYVTEMVLGEYWDIVYKTGGGSGSTYYCDYQPANWGDDYGDMLLIGANADNWGGCGLTSSYAGQGFDREKRSGRLAFYGEPIIVTGAQLVAMINA